MKYALTETISGAVREVRDFGNDTPPVLNDAKGAQWLPYTPPEPVPPTLEELKAQKTAEINGAFEAAMATIKSGYPESEILSWDQQMNEASAYVADPGSDTPMLDAMAAARSLSKAELVARITAKAALFAQFSGSLVGTRQALEDAIAAATLETIGGIAWPG